MFLFTVEEDLKRAWPDAHFPFDPQQWSSFFAHADRLSLLAWSSNVLVGHLGFVKETEQRYRIIFVYLAPDFRGKGYAKRMMEEAERYARSKFKASELSLRVNALNTRAFRLYQGLGFQEFSGEGNTISMEKTLHSTNHLSIESNATRDADH